MVPTKSHRTYLITGRSYPAKFQNIMPILTHKETLPGGVLVELYDDREDLELSYHPERLPDAPRPEIQYLSLTPNDISRLYALAFFIPRKISDPEYVSYPDNVRVIATEMAKLKFTRDFTYLDGTIGKIWEKERYQEAYINNHMEFARMAISLQADAVRNTFKWLKDNKQYGISDATVEEILVERGLIPKKRSADDIADSHI